LVNYDPKSFIFIDPRYTHNSQGTLNKGEIDLLIKVGCFVKKILLALSKGADLNELVKGSQLHRALTFREASMLQPGNTKGGSITVLLTSCLTGLESAVRQLTIFDFISKTD
jgi:hypothetical protein